jgi:hypothetical protein
VGKIGIEGKPSLSKRMSVSGNKVTVKPKTRKMKGISQQNVCGKNRD